MTEEDLKELMEEPPGGHNHGREKSDQGGWAQLETDGTEPSIKRYVGTTTVFTNLRIRALLGEGLSVSEVAKIVGLTPRRVQQILPGRKRGRPSGQS
jgi:hypothetical protein